MGKPSNAQPTHSTIGAVPYARPAHRRRARSKSGSRRDSLPLPKLSVPPVAISSEPSPLEQYHDAEDYLATLPDEDGDVFYEFYEPGEHRPVLTAVHQIIPEPEYDGAAKGRIDRKAGRHGPPPPSSFSPAVPPTLPSTPLASNPVLFARGPAKTTVNLLGHVATNPMAEEARRAVRSLPRKSVNKALVVGINYTTWDKDKRLYYAVNDARLWQKTFMGKGVELENIRIVTDEGDIRNAPTFHNLLGQIRWLVEDARDGDSLFFVFSGHAILTKDHGPCMLTADKTIFPRSLLEQELVMSVPAGVDLQVFFDCCHAAGMIGLQYCVGRMDKPTPPSTQEPESCAVKHEPPEPQALPHQPTPFSHSPQHGSLYGIPTADPAPLPPVTPDMVDLDTFGTLPQRPSRGGVVAAPPLTHVTATAAGAQPGGAAAGAVRYIGSFLGLGSSSAPTPAPPPTPPERPARRACQGVVEGARIPDHFEECQDRFVDPVAKVMVWAGTGERQKAFESYGGVRQGVLTKAMCAALERISTRRDLWSYVVQEIESENTKRSRRDESKSANARPLPSMRTQHAELWVSQAHLTAQPSAAPVLDQPIL